MEIIKMHALRLHPGEDLRMAISCYVKNKNIQAGCILSGIGSLKEGNIRFAGEPEAQIIQGPLEILSLHGSLSQQGLHMHIATSNAQGAVLGGHLANGSIIFTTAEIVIAEIKNLLFERIHDPETGYPELQIKTEE